MQKSRILAGLQDFRLEHAASSAGGHPEVLGFVENPHPNFGTALSDQAFHCGFKDLGLGFSIVKEQVAKVALNHPH